MTSRRPDPRDLAQEALAGLDAARIDLTGLSTALQQGIKPLLEAPLSAADWRAQHCRGTLSKLETDPDLRTFVLARIDRLTFDQVVAEVAANFPPGRRTSRSALHRWWHRRGKLAAASTAKS